MTAATIPLIQASGLTKEYRVGRSIFPAQRSILRAVDTVSLEVYPGETLGLVGESGCGKSTLGRCLTRLTDITSGGLRFEGRDITSLSARAMRPLRRRMQMVFQDPYASLNPRRRVGELIAEPLRVHHVVPEAEIADQVAELLASVELSPDHARRFPHEFSGGQRQRIGIARAIALNPRLIIADEPVSALDVSVQAQIINLFCDLRDRLGLTYVFIAHDLAVVRLISTRVAVMYFGSIVEIGDVEEIFASPRHPYTATLLAATPEVSTRPRGQARALPMRLAEPPSPLKPPPGCRFEPRCSRAQPLCRTERPTLTKGAGESLAACHFPIN